jgi:hypothetical protein
VPKKQTGEIGPTLITAGADGKQQAQIISTPLPSDKEGLEKFFADKFVEAFNRQDPFSDGAKIVDRVQHDTSDLDFLLKGLRVAKYLELAEVNPRSEEFGRSMHASGVANVFECASWICENIVFAKMQKYGATTSGETILLLYSTWSEFLLSQGIMDCVRGLIQGRSCTFAGVFVLITNGQDLIFLETMHPSKARLPPASYKDTKMQNLEPGKTEWAIEI